MHSGSGSETIDGLKRIIMVKVVTLYYIQYPSLFCNKRNLCYLCVFGYSPESTVEQNGKHILCTMPITACLCTQARNEIHVRGTLPLHFRCRRTSAHTHTHDTRIIAKITPERKYWKRKKKQKKHRCAPCAPPPHAGFSLLCPYKGAHRTPPPVTHLTAQKIPYMRI